MRFWFGRRFGVPSLSVALLLAGCMSVSEHRSRSVFKWRELARLPDPIGFAGACVGVSGNALLFAGGANFPDNLGLNGRTKKTWHDRVFALDKVGGTWRRVGRLPRPLGYSVALSTPGGLACIGGSDADRHYSDAFLIQYSRGSVTIVSLPSLPKPIANATGAIVGGTIYVAGGLEEPASTVAEHSFYSLNLQAREPRWQREPSWPGPERMLAIGGGLDGRFVLAGGVHLGAEKATGKTSRSYLADAYAFEPSRRGWSRLADLPFPLAGAPSPAATDGARSRLLIFGGDSGEYAARAAKLGDAHPGFNRTILSYRFRENAWRVVGEIPMPSVKDPARPNGEPWAPVTTPLVEWQNRIVLPSGEVRPGVRTPRVLATRVRRIK